MFSTFTTTQSKSPLTATRTSASRASAQSIILPYMPDSVAGPERDIYMSFISAFRQAPHRRMEVRILTAIHRAADATDNSDAYVSRVLADFGLMAPRLAFPGDFLDHVDASMLRERPLHSVPAAYLALTQHWAAIGEELYAMRSPIQTNDGRLHSFLGAF